MSIDDLFTHEQQQTSPRTRRTLAQLSLALTALIGGIAGVGGLLWVLAGSFQGTFLDVSTCGYADVDSDCQADLRNRVRDTFHIPLNDDVRIDRFRTYGFPDPSYEARLIFPSAKDAANQDVHGAVLRPDGTVLVTITRRE